MAMMKNNQIKKRGIFPIGVKLVLITSILLIASLGAVIALVSVLSSIDVQRTAEYNNFSINRSIASQAESSLNSIKASVLLYADIKNNVIAGQNTGIENNLFRYNQNIVSINISGHYIFNEKFLLSNNINEDAVKKYFNSKISDKDARSDIMTLFNASSFFTRTMFCAMLAHEKEIVKILFSPDDLLESFGVGTNTSFIVTNKGSLLLHPDTNLILSDENLSSLEIIKIMLKEGNTNGKQISYADDTGEQFFGTYCRLSGTDSAVITTIPYSIVFEAVWKVVFLNILLTCAVLFLAVMFIWFFSKTISNPVRSLADAALQIESGEFGIDLKAKTNDEIGLLTESFGKMTGALNIFGRFTNKDIAVRAMRGEIKPGGLPKHATIFFSDIRGFTEKSENFTKTYGDEASNRIIGWLNEYFTQMVSCVEKTGGVVDKFIGDAVMAHWGTAFTAGSPAQDAFNAVKAAIMMRNALYKLNKQREKNDPGNPVITIGCGLNTGIITAGQLGSEQRMEYTVIGDPVNLASRTEALNKPLGTDILITEDTWNFVKDQFITEEMPPVIVKGKEKPVRMFAVVNLKGAQGPQTLAEVRKLLNITPPDISMVDTNAEEKKYKIQSD